MNAVITTEMGHTYQLKIDDKDHLHEEILQQLDEGIMSIVVLENGFFYEYNNETQKWQKVELSSVSSFTDNGDD